MKKKFLSISITIGVLIGAAVLAYAITNYVISQREKSPFTSKEVFQAELSTGMQEAEIGPGDTVTVSPTVYNDATGNMYVFIVVEQPTCSKGELYTYTVEDSWKTISETDEKQIYAYAGDEMTLLLPGETTEPLTSQMTMQSITNAEFSQIDDINFTISAYEVKVDDEEDVPTDPEAAWAYCKLKGNIE